ncbi:hypothetical protein KC19_2G052600 [Ceratodon purpureus]|uniref:Uncharacterized protein n=1 Tax=Ceratodon purpureus TaxID=3225 RepID=A0A8T0ISG7_CERPU|nr:hypothetical protein KC19_2G052600 [Ceratodon purpureus]
MGAMTRMGWALVVMLVVSSTHVRASFAGFDGQPRPTGMDDQPSTTLGAVPAVNYNGKRADCTWYAWENFHYPPEQTSNCSKLLWTSLSKGGDASSLEGYSYYAPIGLPEFYDPQYDEYFCVIGCFNLAATSGSGPSAAPPNAPVNAPPPVASTPPPAIAPASTPAVPPPSPPTMAPPPPATLFRPPPPGLPQPPPSIVSPPGGTTPAPGPGSSQASGGICTLRPTSRSSLLILMAAIFLSVGTLGFL